MNKTITPINILLIEDNPAQEGIKAKDLRSRGIDIRDLADNIDVPAVNFKGKNKGLHKLFTLKILQHPEEIKEFISNCLEKEDKEGPTALGSINGVVPEIVVFDYKLGDNFQINSENGENQGMSRMKYWSTFKKLREHYNPNFLFTNEQFLEQKENENYTIKDFIERINNKVGTAIGNEDWYIKDEKDLKHRDDELGLYAGVEITRLFRNHICIGIPATFNFNIRERLHAFGKFYEWMNDFDLGSMFSREERGKKDWDSVLSSAVKQLRIRIEAQLKSNKITLNLSEMLAWATDNPTEQESLEQAHRVFTFESFYGVRHLPLDGLFIDKDLDKRDKAIKKWCIKLLSHFQKDEYINAKKASIKLIDAYQAIPVIRNRIRLSRITVKLCNGETLTSDEKNELEKLKTEFGIGDAQIENCIDNGDAEHSNLTNKVVEYRKFKTSDNVTNRLIVLFTDLQVHRVWQNFCEMNKNSDLDGQISTLLKGQPTLDDLIAALFPIPKNPLVLPYHYHLLVDKKKFKKKEPFDVWESHFSKRKMHNEALFPKADFPKGLSRGEIQLCKSLALEISLISDYFPNWLK